MDTILQWLDGTIGVTPGLQRSLLSSVATILILWLIRRVVLAAVARRAKDVRIRYRWNKTSAYVAGVIGIMLVGRIWFAGLSDLTTFLGLLSAGIAIALKDLVANLAGWAFILWRRPFEVGDRVQIGEHRGDVIDIRIFQFTLLEIGNWVDADQSTGRLIHVPNGHILTEVLGNYTKGFQYIWNEIPVLVTFESNWEKAKEILARVVTEHAEYLSEDASRRLREAAHRFMIFYDKLTPIVYTSVEDSGVLLTVRYLCKPRHRRDSAATIWEDILAEFAKCNDIDFAYPTQRFYNNPAEGKPQARATPPR